LQKTGPTSNCAAAGATIDGVEGITLTELGWDYRNDGRCGGGAPRFHIVTTAGTFVIGCDTATKSPINANWTRARMSPPPGEVISIDIIFDEGTDFPGGTGFVYLDNIDINGTLIGKPGNA
jgi:hypothetical protein